MLLLLSRVAGHAIERTRIFRQNYKLRLDYLYSLHTTVKPVRLHTRLTLLDV